MSKRPTCACELGKWFTLKEKSIGSPEKYLGRKFSQFTVENGVECWRFSSSQCDKDAVKNAEDCRSRAILGLLLKAK